MVIYYYDIITSFMTGFSETLPGPFRGIFYDHTADPVFRYRCILRFHQ